MVLVKVSAQNKTKREEKRKERETLKIGTMSGSRPKISFLFFSLGGGGGGGVFWV